MGHPSVFFFDKADAATLLPLTCQGCLMSSPSQSGVRSTRAPCPSGPCEPAHEAGQTQTSLPAGWQQGQ